MKTPLCLDIDMETSQGYEIWLGTVSFRDDVRLEKLKLQCIQSFTELF
ncbi:MAG: hypothetical protein WBG66_07285 [Geitlerinemataceae cyanobacterium]